MVKFGENIINALENNKTDNIMNKLSKIQKSLITNYSNPVFSDSDKNNLLKKYTKIEILGKSIYKYLVLKQNDLNSQAQSEKENLVVR